MLVLSRKEGSVVFIGDAITVTVLDIQGDKVKLGITAPDDVLILRQEVIKQTSTIPRQCLAPEHKEDL